uniref:protein-tyrosine-phosphatase n=1 Tax=Panagrellus redivivus TaxID=6233 RepID=A0A7E4V285_PANRE
MRELYVYGINGLAPITVVTRLTGCKGISPKELFILYFVSPICGSAFGNILMTSPKPAQKVTSLDDKSILLSGKTLRDQLVEMTDTMFNDRYMLIDVRKPHEYEGGHIKHAINIYQKDQTVKYLYERDCFNIRKFRIPIFYSETKTRALLMLQAVRKADRGRNMSRYAFLDYPEQYVLDGGYKEFYTSFNAERDLCEPNLYVPRQQG